MLSRCTGHPRQEWSIAGVANLDSDASQALVAKANAAETVACSLLHLTGGAFLDELVDHPSFRALNASSIVDQKAPLVEVVFECLHPWEAKPFVPIQKGSVRLDPAQSWCVRSADLECRYSTGPATSRVRHEYRVAEDGIPVPIKVTDHTQLIVEEQGKRERSATVREATFGFTRPRQLPDDSEFTLSSFGFPEPKPDRRLLYLLMFAGIALVVAGVVIRRKLAAR